MIDGQILIGGAWREAQGGGTIPAVNPSNGSRFGAHPARAIRAVSNRSVFGINRLAYHRASRFVRNRRFSD